MTDPRTLDTTTQPPADGGAIATDEATPALTTADISGRAGNAGQQAVEPEGGRPGAGSPAAPGADTMNGNAAPLFDERAASELRSRWSDVQAGFVDEPRQAVERADGLVADVMKRLADSFASERQSLEQQWSSGGNASTEDLRIALRRYRSFFDRLLSI